MIDKNKDLNIKLDKKYIEFKMLQKYQNSNIHTCYDLLSEDMELTKKSTKNLINSKKVRFDTLKKLIIILELDLDKVFKEN